MKKTFLTILGVAALMVACTPKQKEAEPAAEGDQVAAEAAAPAEAPAEEKVLTAKDLQPGKSQIDSVSYLLGVNIGSMIKGNNFGDLNYKKFLAGIKDFIKAEGNPYSEGFDNQFKIAPSTMGEVINGYLMQRQQYVGMVNKEAGEKFLAANAGRPGVEVSPSGLQYKIVAPGDAELKPGPQDTVLVRYCGKLLDGTIFDETKEDADPVRLTLNRVIPGWTEGMQLVGKGGEIDLFIPGDLAYGARGNQGIEPNSTLIFNVKIEDVFPYVAPAVEEEAK